MNPAIASEAQVWLRKQIFSVALVALMLFAAAGRWDWALGWVHVAVYAASVAAQVMFVSPALLAERARLRPGTPRWDVVLTTTAVVFLPMAGWVVAGLDARWGWSGAVPLWVVVGGVGLMLAGWALVIWAMASNAFFSATVRIQHERGHTVIDAGPYAWVRHPGYVGTVIFQLAAPLTLGSWWALIPNVAAVLLLVVRTALEDATLHRDLPGYAEYAQRVRYRLVPGVW